jgi:hypothetical protein
MEALERRGNLAVQAVHRRLLLQGADG